MTDFIVSYSKVNNIISTYLFLNIKIKKLFKIIIIKLLHL